MNASRCRLCGSTKNVLTLEHVPPKSIGNEGTTVIEAVSLDAGMRVVEVVPDGVSLRVLCKRCNNNTGSRLGTGFGDFANQVRNSGTFESPSGGALVSTVQVFPARVIRQLLLCFLCAQPGDPGSRWDPLRAFIRGRDPGLPPDAPQVSLYFNTADTYKIVPICGVGSLGQLTKGWTGSEIAAPNLGVYFSLGDSGPASIARLVGKVPEDISHWADYGFGDRETFALRLPRFRVEDPHPLGYGRPREFLEWERRQKIMWAVAEPTDPDAVTATAVLWRVRRGRPSA